MVYRQNGGMVEHGLQAEWWDGSAWFIGRMVGLFSMVIGRMVGWLSMVYRQNGGMVEHGL